MFFSSRVFNSIVEMPLAEFEIMFHKFDNKDSSISQLFNLPMCLYLSVLYESREAHFNLSVFNDINLQTPG